MSFLIAFRPLLFHLAAFAVGAGLTAAWHFQKESFSAPGAATEAAAPSPGSKPSQAAESPDFTNQVQPGSTIPERDDGTTDPQMAQEMEESLTPDELAEARRYRRLEILELSLRLGLNPAQSSDLEATSLRGIHSPSTSKDWLVGDNPVPRWMKENLTTGQTQAYSRYLEDIKREMPEAQALEELHRMDSLFELTDEQRSTFLERETSRLLMRASRPMEEFLPGDSVKLSSEERLADVRQILTAEQLRIYRNFLLEEEKLLALKASELEEESGHE